MKIIIQEYKINVIFYLSYGIKIFWHIKILSLCMQRCYRRHLIMLTKSVNHKWLLSYIKLQNIRCSFISLLGYISIRKWSTKSKWKGVVHLHNSHHRIVTTCYLC